MKYLDYLGKVAHKIAREFNLPIKSLTWVDTLVHPQTKKPLWGLCYSTRGDIYVAVADRRYLHIANTIAHELAHLRVRGHEKDFHYMHKRLALAVKNLMGSKNIKILKKAGKQKHLIFCEEQK